MIKTYFKTAFRSLGKNKLLSSINIAGLAIGMTVALAIGLWMWDELTFDAVHTNKSRVAQVIQNVTNNGEVQTWTATPWPLADEIRKNYGGDFDQVVLTAARYEHMLSIPGKKINMPGLMAEPGFEEMFSLKIMKGNGNVLKDASSILLSASAAKTWFADADPINQTLMLDDLGSVRVAGVFADLPSNSTFSDLKFVGSWELFRTTHWIKTMDDIWRPNAFNIFVKLADKADFKSASLRIRDAKLKRVNEMLARKKPALFLQPMDAWHLHGEYKNGVNTGGRIQYVWLFGIIGVFVLLMACINFMNLTTARSEQRAKEVGIRKTIGSVRGQLILQFFCESAVVSFIALLVSLLCMKLALPVFNRMTDKQTSIPFDEPLFWLFAVAFALATAAVCGSYPALYLSSIEPGKALKGTYRAGRSAGLSRKGLVVVQFTISVILIVGSVTVFQQIKFAKSRPVGYNRTSLIGVAVNGSIIHDHFQAFVNELKKSGAVEAVSESGNMPTQGAGSTSGLVWPGKDPNLSTDFQAFGSSAMYGQTIGWEISAGRDFSPDIVSDSSAIIINEAALSFMGLKDPIGQTLHWWGEPRQIIGVVKDMVFASPYEAVRPGIYVMDKSAGNFLVIRLNAEKPTAESIASIQQVYKQYLPEEPFTYQFADTEYARKFGNEDRIGTLGSVFTFLAIIISGLGIFGLSSFQAEQRTKEIGIRKVLGASVVSLWTMLCGNFVTLVIMSCLLAAPLAYYGLNNWLKNFTYRTEFPWWTLVAASAGTLLITLLTVSYHTLHAAHARPVQSLRSE